MGFAGTYRWWSSGTGYWGRGREIGGGRTSTPRIRHMLLLLLLLPLLLLLLPAFDNNYTPASRNPYKPPSIPLDYRRKSRCAGEASREGNRFASKLADHYAKLAKCDGTRFHATTACQLWEVICEMILVLAGAVVTVFVYLLNYKLWKTNYSTCHTQNC